MLGMYRKPEEPIKYTSLACTQDQRSNDPEYLAFGRAVEAYRSGIIMLTQQI
jgi:hypothetical protein